jgi:hypothetical protein
LPQLVQYRHPQKHKPTSSGCTRRLSGRRLGYGCGEQSCRLGRERARLEAFEDGSCLEERARGLTTAPEFDETSAAE